MLRSTSIGALCGFHAEKVTGRIYATRMQSRGMARSTLPHTCGRICDVKAPQGGFMYHMEDAPKLNAVTAAATAAEAVRFGVGDASRGIWSRSLISTA